MKRMIAALFVGALLGAAGFSFWHKPEPVAAQEAAEPIDNLDAHLLADEAYQKADLEGRMKIVAELAQSRRVHQNQARGIHMRELLAHARANDMDPDKNLVAFVQWLGAETKNNTEIRQASTRTRSIDALIETYGALRLWRDETFVKGNAQVKIARINELWIARELDQSQSYDLMRMYIYEHLAPAGDDVDEQLELFDQLVKSDSLDWVGSVGTHRALLTRALEEKKDLDTIEKKLEWIAKNTGNRNTGLSGLVVGTRRVTLFMHAMDAEMAGLNYEERAAKIKEWQDKGLLDNSAAVELRVAYGATK